MAVPTSGEIVLLVKPVAAEAREVTLTRQEWNEAEAEFLRLGHAPSLSAYFTNKIGSAVEWIRHQDQRRASGRVRKVA